jgi:hypothetical protein
MMSHPCSPKSLEAGEDCECQAELGYKARPYVKKKKKKTTE